MSISHSTVPTCQLTVMSRFPRPHSVSRDGAAVQHKYKYSLSPSRDDSFTFLLSMFDYDIERVRSCSPSAAHSVIPVARCP